MRKIYCDICGQEINPPKEEISEYKLPLVVVDSRKYDDMTMSYGSKVVNVNMEICARCKYKLGSTITELRWKNNVY